MEQRHGTRGSRIAWPARVLIGGLAGAAASASWFLWLSPALFIIGQALGLGTSVLFLLRRPERELAAGIGFALAVAAVIGPDVYLFSVSQTCCD